MFESQKHVFWQALLATILIFGLGLLIGFALEDARTSKISNMYTKSEIDLIDMRAQSDVYGIGTLDCGKVVEENIKFADRIYEEAKLLDKYQEASKLSDEIILEHKKYDLLRTLVWTNSIKIKQTCNASYHNIVYLYNYRNLGVEERAKQQVFSKMLQDLKDRQANNIMLIPIAADSDLASLNILLGTFNITSFPTILIDEKTKIENVENVTDIEQHL